MPALFAQDQAPVTRIDNPLPFRVGNQEHFRPHVTATATNPRILDTGIAVRLKQRQPLSLLLASESSIINPRRQVIRLCGETAFVKEAELFVGTSATDELPTRKPTDLHVTAEMMLFALANTAVTATQNLFARSHFQPLAKLSGNTECAGQVL
jgi:hypothetical protein